MYIFIIDAFSMPPIFDAPTKQKFVARKARKYQIQNKSLALPALELAYLFQAIAHAPRKILAKKMLPEVWDTLAKLGWDACGYEESTPRNKDIVSPSTWMIRTI